MLIPRQLGCTLRRSYLINMRNIPLWFAEKPFSSSASRINQYFHAVQMMSQSPAKVFLSAIQIHD